MAEKSKPTPWYFLCPEQGCHGPLVYAGEEHHDDEGLLIVLRCTECGHVVRRRHTPLLAMMAPSSEKRPGQDEAVDQALTLGEEINCPACKAGMLISAKSLRDWHGPVICGSCGSIYEPKERDGKIELEEAYVTSSCG